MVSHIDHSTLIIVLLETTIGRQHFEIVMSLTKVEGETYLLDVSPICAVVCVMKP